MALIPNNTYVCQDVTNDHHQNHHKLLVFYNKSPKTFQTIDCEAPEDGLTVSRCVPFNYDYMTILASVNGLVSVGIEKFEFDYDFSYLIFWSPLTGEYKMLSKLNFDDKSCRLTKSIFGLYHSSCDDYKLLCITNNWNVYIYSLKSDLWRVIDTTHDFKRLPYEYLPEFWPSVFLKENFYFLRKGRPNIESHSTYFIVVFDIATEKFKDVPTPSFENPSTVQCLSFTVSIGCIYLLAAYKNIETRFYSAIELWRMDGDRKWSKVAIYDTETHFSLSWWPLHLTRNGNWLMKCKHDIYKVDVENHSKDKNGSL